MRLLCSCLFILSVSGFAQDSTYRYELSGTISYSYSNVNGHFSFENFEEYIHTHTVSFQPSVGYFLSSVLEIVVQPEYDFTYNEDGNPYYDPDTHTLDAGRKFIDRIHDIGAQVGFSYHVPVSPTIRFFGGAKIGFFWFGSISSGPSDGDAFWHDAQLRFPILNGGMKMFVAQNWALVMQLQYTHISHPDEFYGADFHKDLILTGVGVAGYLK